MKLESMPSRPDGVPVRVGLYIHVPFCARKCPYCDFYSLTADDDTMDAYVEAVIRSLGQWRDRLRVPADTLYVGGGTPSLLGARRMARLVAAAREAFALDGGEITMEANPGDDLSPVFAAFAAEGGNRVSIGLQAANDDALRRLGRRHTVAQAAQAVRAAQAAGIDNVSLDLMLGVEGQREADVYAGAAFCRSLGAAHVSAYLLKIEEGTPFGASPPPLPDEEQTAALYRAACDALEAQGYAQYEISNFAASGRRSRHNLKYWQGDPYLGIGPAAHSFIGGRRFFYPRDLRAFLAGGEPQAEAPDDADAMTEGGEEEYAMLRLRLTDGLTAAAFEARFGRPFPAAWVERARRLPPGLVTADADGIRLTRDGFLVSNAVIAAVLFGG